MSRSAFDAEVALDLAVNIIPAAIIVFFVLLFAVFNPWGVSLVPTSIQFTLLLSMVVAVAVVTYVGARLIEGDGAHRHREEPQSVDDEHDTGQRHHERESDQHE